MTAAAAAVAWSLLSLLALLTLSPRVLPARAAVREGPATTATAAVVRVWRRAHDVREKGVEYLCIWVRRHVSHTV